MRLTAMVYVALSPFSQTVVERVLACTRLCLLRQQKQPGENERSLTLVPVRNNLELDTCTYLSLSSVTYSLESCRKAVMRFLFHCGRCKVSVSQPQACIEQSTILYLAEQNMPSIYKQSGAQERKNTKDFLANYFSGSRVYEEERPGNVL